MSNRSVAYVSTIIGIEDLPGKDKIKYCTIRSGTTEWKVIADKDHFINEKVVYIEYDSVIEAAPWNEFLRSRCFSPKYNGMYIRAMRMAGVVSYGIIFRFSEIWLYDKTKIENMERAAEGVDLSEIIKVKSADSIIEGQTEPLNKPSKLEKFIKKYTYIIWKLIYKNKKVSGNFPSFAAIKTDETRAQNMQWIFSDLKGKRVYSTVKCLDQEMIINTDRGDLTIKEICSNNTKYKVRGFNNYTGRIEWTKIKKKFTNDYDSEWFEIITSNGKKLLVTENHPVFVQNLNAYREAKNLKIGDILITN